MSTQSKGPRTPKPHSRYFTKAYSQARTGPEFTAPIYTTSSQTPGFPPKRLLHCPPEMLCPPRTLQKKDLHMTNKRIWDLPVRLSHWGLALSFFGAYMTSEGPLIWMHIPFAYALATLALFRVFWGLFGSENARFSHFVRGYGAIRAYSAGLKELRHKEYWGHNPVGALAVLAILLTSLALVAAAVFAQGRGIAGPWAGDVTRQTSGLMTDVHILLANLLMTIVIVHIGAIFAYKYVLKDNLITPMITGTRPASPDQPEPRFTSLSVAVVLLVVAAAITSIAFRYWGLV